MCQHHGILWRFSWQKIQGISFPVASLPIVYACNLWFIHTKFSLVFVFTLLYFADDSVWMIVDRQNLNIQFKRSVLCQFWEGESVSIQEVERVRLWAVWSFNCNNPDCSSHVLNNSFHTTPKRNHFNDLNQGLRVKKSLLDLQKRNLDIELTACDGNLSAWTMTIVIYSSDK